MTTSLTRDARRCAVGLCVTAVTTLSAQAAVIDHADVHGLHTFQDLSTGLVWLDLNNFVSKTPNQMISVANAAGFTFAGGSSVISLLTSLPLNGGQWSSYKAIMGDSPSREFIWGAYNQGDPNSVGMFSALPTDTTWRFQDGFGYNTVGGSDMNIWAYQQPVPEPETVALMVAGLAAVGAVARRRTQAAA